MNNEYKGLRFSNIAIPRIAVDAQQYKWYSSADVDVTRTWRAHGWRPLNEQTNSTPVQARATVRALRQM
jgi:hypothetical protein